jgi:hypothetical protein
MPNLNELMEAVEENDWEFVNKQIGETVTDPDIIGWALRGFHHPSREFRDLAATILWKSRVSIPLHTQTIILDRIRNDQHLYVRFHLACALFTRGDRSDLVIDTLKQSLGNPNIAEIARGYLDQAKREKEAAKQQHSS